MVQGVHVVCCYLTLSFNTYATYWQGRKNDMVQSNCILFTLCSLMHTYEQVQVSKMDQIEIVAKARCTINGVGLIFFAKFRYFRSSIVWTVIHGLARAKLL